MKKKLITIIIGMVFCIGWIGGCASKEINHDNVATSVTEESKQEGVKKEKLPTATYKQYYYRDLQRTQFCGSFTCRYISRMGD